MPKPYTTFLTVILSLMLLVGSEWAAAHPLEGRPAPPIRARTLDGKSFDLSWVKKDVIVLDFWATWCPPCRKGLPLLQQYQDWAKEHKKSAIAFAINLREDRKKVSAYWKKEGFTMPVVMDTDGRIGQTYGVRGIPQTVVIHKGKIVTVHVGYSPGMTEMLKLQTEKLLEESDR